MINTDKPPRKPIARSPCVWSDWQILEGGTNREAGMRAEAFPESTWSDWQILEGGTDRKDEACGHMHTAGPSRYRSAKSVRRVLVADPCADTVESAAWLLRLWGHDVRGVGTGHEVLALARAYRPDTILMETALPGLDGFEVARRLRQQDTNREILLVAVTGYGDEKNRRRSHEAGFDCHLIKPVEPEVLRSLLAEEPLMERRNAQF